MKTLTLISVFVLTIGTGLLNAQTSQGSVLIGVSSTLSLAGSGSDLMGLGFSSIKYKSDIDGFENSDSDKMTSINLQPKIGYFVNDNLALGLDLNIALSSEKNGEDGDKYSQTLLGAGPFVRYYIPKSKVSPFIEISGSFGSLKDKYNSEDGFKSSITSIGGGVGLAAPLGEKVLLDILAGYNTLTVKDKEDNEDNFRSVIGTLGLKIGFTILLGSN